jgi:hypothetical protein
MKAKLLRTTDKYDYLLVSIDDPGLSYLAEGIPIRIAFFADNNEDLPWYMRRCMVAVIGKKLDFDQYKSYPSDIFKDGIVDKSYLVDYMNKMKAKFIQMTARELKALNIPIQIGNIEQNLVDLEPKKEIQPRILPEILEIDPERPKEPEEYLKTSQVLEMLGISRAKLLNLIRQGKIKCRTDLLERLFFKKDIEKLLEEKPDFLTRAWSYYGSVKNRESIIYDNEEYIHLQKAQTILNLSRNSIEKYIKLGFIANYKKEPRRAYYISKRYMDELKANPPDWLKKAWIYYDEEKQTTQHDSWSTRT